MASSVADLVINSEKNKVKVAITDIDGILRGEYLHKDKFLSALKSGFGFCNVVLGWDSADVCYDNVEFTGWHSGYPDANVMIDPKTFRKIPWDGKVPFFLGDFVDSTGKALEICPRQILKKAIARAETLGFHSLFGMEFEWFNFKETPHTLADKRFVNPEPLTPGMFGYSILRSSYNQPFFQALMDELLEFGIPVEGLHTETGPGVFEAAIAYSDTLEAADRAVLFKTSVKEIAYRFQIMPSFMAKWNMDLPGCSGHLHQSLLDKNKERNLFYDDKDPYKMSETYKQYLAGQMACLPEFLALFAPTVNSYKRLVEGYWAPTRVTWGIDNRTTAFRVISGSSKSARLEARVPGSDVNPYLAMAAALAGGLYGIENKLKLKDAPIQGSAYQAKDAVRLSRNLIEATDKFSNSKIAKEFLGEKFVDHFSKSREWEWKRSQEAVTDWELKRYFEII